MRISYMYIAFHSSKQGKQNDYHFNIMYGHLRKTKQTTMETAKWTLTLSRCDKPHRFHPLSFQNLLLWLAVSPFSSHVLISLSLKAYS